MLLILKILGIILLVLLGVALLLVVIVLFVPIHYRYIGRYDRDNKQDNCSYLLIRWIARILSCRIDIGINGVSYTFRIFGIKSRLLDRLLSDSDDIYEEDDDIEDVPENDINKEMAEKSVEIGTSESKVDDKNDEDIDEMDEIESIWEELVEDDEVDEVYNIIKNKEQKNKKFDWRSFVKYLNPINLARLIKDKLKQIIKVIINLIKSIIHLVRKTYVKYEIIQKYWNNKATIQGIDRIREYVNKICKSILPKKKKIELNIGFENPAHTGYVLALLGPVYGQLGNSMVVRPDFNETKLELTCELKGRIRGINILIITLRVIKDKALKRFMKIVDKLKEELNNVE